MKVKKPMAKAAPRARKKRAAVDHASVPAAAPNSRTLQKEATRAAILQSALQIFSERGFDGGSTRDIAAHAGVHQALIKYHFDNKDRLWRAAVSFLFERQAQKLGFDLPARPYPRGREGRRAHAREILRQYVVYCACHPEHARLMMQEGLRDTPRLKWAAEVFVSVTAARAERFVRMLQHERMLPDVSVPALVYILVGGAQLFYVLAPEVRHVWGIDPTDEKVSTAHIEALLAVFLR